MHTRAKQGMKQDRQHCSPLYLTALYQARHVQKAKQGMRQGRQHCSPLDLTALCQARYTSRPQIAKQGMRQERQHCSPLDLTALYQASGRTGSEAGDETGKDNTAQHSTSLLFSKLTVRGHHFSVLCQAFLETYRSSLLFVQACDLHEISMPRKSEKKTRFPSTEENRGVFATRAK